MVLGFGKKKKQADEASPEDAADGAPDGDTAVAAGVNGLPVWLVKDYSEMTDKTRGMSTSTTKSASGLCHAARTVLGCKA